MRVFAAKARCPKMGPMQLAVRRFVGSNPIASTKESFQVAAKFLRFASSPIKNPYKFLPDFIDDLIDTS